jgi:hypothetical protein
MISGEGENGAFQRTIEMTEHEIYKPNAGVCEKCGNNKTWDFKIPNKNSGKLMPGHIDGNGHKLGEGDCPFFTNLKKKQVDVVKKVFDIEDHSEPVKTPAPVIGPVVVKTTPANLSEQGKMTIEPDRITYSQDIKRSGGNCGSNGHFFSYSSSKREDETIEQCIKRVVDLVEYEIDSIILNANAPGGNDT